MVNGSGSELSCPCTLGFIIRDVTSQMAGSKLPVASVSTLWPGVQPSVANIPALAPEDSIVSRKWRECVVWGKGKCPQNPEACADCV